MTKKAQQWSERIAAWQRSGQTRAAFCQTHGLNRNTFDYWRRRLPDAQVAAKPAARRRRNRALVPVAVAGGTPALAEIALADGLRLRVALDADPAQVAALVRALAAC